MKDKTIEILQKIHFNHDKIDNGLFYKSDGNILISDNTMIIGKNSNVNFGTYFNSFSVGKWKKYTQVDSVLLEISFKGCAEITLYANKILYGNMHRIIVQRKIINSDEISTAILPYDCKQDVICYSFSLQVFSNEFELYSGRYITTEKYNRNNVYLALIFTTYNREAYIKKNLKNIKECNAQNIHTYVIDNASNLAIRSTESVTVRANSNVGGAGGFALGMISAIDDMDRYHYTHCILMDDDANIEAFVIERLITFLEFVKEKYQDSFVSGAMLRKDLSYYQVESGALWNQGRIKSNGQGIDLRDEMQCMLNSKECGGTDYAAWWFCVVPIKYIRNDNLPLPIFVFNDDVDFSIRNKPNIITINGVCVWHDAFESKRNVMRCYYESRNRLIVNSCNCLTENKRQCIRNLKRIILFDVNLYQYQNAYATLKGVEDYLKGPEWLLELNAEDYNNHIIKHNIKMERVDLLNFNYEWYRLCCTIKDCDKLHKFVRRITKNGYYLPADREMILPLYALNEEAGYRAKKIIYYDEITNKGFTVLRDKKERKKIFKEYRIIKKQIKKRYDLVDGAYKKQYEDLTSRKFWNKYLELKE